ncbi:MAG: GNAT family N-acetyltransferase [Spirochaetales bacterium]|uniref:GNAT family N-acetyltransferase n=1 Tax=Candidatus Thalassospirochaeta sargassi TaxID=3119039 RepID=A0AAJ1IG09_9SPIO|nr:GNAT family N-acetyltransferase [Spirochaetales bacterium]
MSEKIFKLTPTIETRIRRNPLLNLDTFIIPSPYVRDSEIEKDYDHSYIWIEEREILGYMQVYSDAEQKTFHIYKIVVSPFGRSRGIGKAFIHHLADMVPVDAEIYLYLWEKQPDTLEFFKEQGFTLGESIVYRNLVYYLITGTKEKLLNKRDKEKKDLPESAEIGKTRHDARKIVRLLSHMVDSLSAENCDKIVEDINRETTTLINMLNYFRDSRKIMHEVNLRDLILDRIVPFVQASHIKCCLQIKLNTKNATVLGYHENIGRALINIVSNSLDAIEEKGIKGFLKISLAERNDEIILSIRDNGIGISEDLLKKDDSGRPEFVGKTTKHRKAGEGLGTIQIYSTFGSENISIQSSSKGTGWKIRFHHSTVRIDQRYMKMHRRFSEFQDLWEEFNLEKKLTRNEIITYIWQLRKMEIFMFDLILMFSNYNNIRSIYRTILGFFENPGGGKKLREFIYSLKSERVILNDWLFNISKDIKKRKTYLLDTVGDIDLYTGARLKSYGQAFENVIIFTMDPETGNFRASDRKLAEHLDFAQYLGKPRNELLRGEFSGDINNDEKPIALGVWSIDSEEDLLEKLKLIRQAAVKMIEMGIHRKKRLAFYQTTYPNYRRDIDSDKSTTFHEMANCSDEELLRFAREVDDEEFDFLMQVD